MTNKEMITELENNKKDSTFVISQETLNKCIDLLNKESSLLHIDSPRGFCAHSISDGPVRSYYSND